MFRLRPVPRLMRAGATDQPCKALEQPGQVLRRNHLAGVFHREHDLAFLPNNGHGNLPPAGYGAR